MKKLKSVLALMLCLGMTFTAAACSFGRSKDNDGSGSGSGNNNGSGNIGGSGGLGGNGGSGGSGGSNPDVQGPSYDEIKGETITESEWTAAFSETSFVNYSFDLTMDTNVSPISQIADELITTGKVSGGDIWLREATPSSENYSGVTFQVKYYTLVNGTYQASTQQEDTTWSEWSNASDPLAEQKEQRAELKTGYSSFSYNASTGAYTAKNYMGYALAEIKFSDGKVTGISMRMEETSANMYYEQHFVFYDYGTTKLPEKPTPSTSGGGQEDLPGSEVSASVWKSALSAENFTNYTLVAQITSSYDSPISQTLMRDEDSYYMWQSASGSSLKLYYLPERDGSYMCYIYTGEKWTATQMTDPELPDSLLIPILEELIAKRDLFTYDRSKGVYFAEDIEILGLDVWTLPTDRADRAELKFANGHLVNFTVSVPDVERTMTFSDYGSTELPPFSYETDQPGGSGSGSETPGGESSQPGESQEQRPQEPGGSGGESNPELNGFSEDEWLKALHPSNFTNFSVDVEGYLGEKDYLYYSIQVTDRGIYIENRSSGECNYFVADAYGKVTLYTYNSTEGSGWQQESYNGSWDDLFALLLTSLFSCERLQKDYAKFTYSGAQYFATNYSMELALRGLNEYENVTLRFSSDGRLAEIGAYSKAGEVHLMFNRYGTTKLPAVPTVA